MIDLDLIRKYNVAGPRYTSYPTAVQFREDLDPEAVWGSIRRDNEARRDVSLYFHIPFCDTLCYFCGCTTVITTNHGVTTPYLDHLEKEMATLAARLDPARRVVQIHFGGGTPTFLDPPEIRRLGAMIRSRFTLADDVEFGVEIDPRGLTREHVRALREIGCNRASMGVQDNAEEVQKAVNRIQPLEMTTEVVSWLRDEGFASINLDLIYGLPLQTRESFGRTLGEIVALSPDRLAVFSYAHVPWLKKHQTVVEKAGPAAAELKLELFALTIERLTESGYVYVGMDHFALPADELVVAQREDKLQRNFQGYSTRGGASIHGFGMSAISQTDDVYFQNEKDVKAYYGRVEAGIPAFVRGCALTADDRIRRDAIMSLMCRLKLDYAELSRLHAIDAASYLEKEVSGLGDLEEDGLVSRASGGVRVTEKGRLFIRNIAMRFDAYLDKTEKRYSRTV